MAKQEAKKAVRLSRIVFPVIAILVLFSHGAFGWFNDSGNDSCLTLYSDQQYYHAGWPAKQVEAIIKVENKCKAAFTTDFSLLLNKKSDADFKQIYLWDGKTWVDASKSFSPGTGTTGKPLSAGWSGVPVPLGESLFKIVFLPQVDEGEFFVFARNDKNALEASVLDPWFDSEIAADSYTLGLWHFNENAGVTAASDVNSTTMDLTLSNASWDAANKKFGASSFKTDGAGIRATDADPLSFTPIGNSLSFSFWFMPYENYNNGTPASNWYLFSKTNVNVPESTVLIYLATGEGKMHVNTKAAGVECNIVSTTSSWAITTWYHVLVTWNSVSGTRLYVNGVKEATGATCTSLLPSGTATVFSLGATPGGGVPSNAAFDDLEIAGVDRNATNPGGAGSDFYIDLKKLGGLDVDGTQKIYSYAVDGNVRIDFNILNSDSNRVLLDLNYSTQPYVGTGTKIVGDLNVSDAMCDDANTDWKNSARPCHWDFNISGVTDGNYYLVANAKNEKAASYYDGNVSDISTSLFGIDNIPDLNASFFDENKNNLIRGMKVLFNGVEYTVDLNLVIVMNGMAQGVYPLKVWQDNNYGVRYFDINYHGQSTVLNAYVLHDYNGINIDFQFYNNDETALLSNAFVKVMFGTNITQMRQLNASGETSFFLHPDRNYSFLITRADGSMVNYHSATITCAVPKDETTLLPVATYTIAVSDLANRQYLNITAPKVTWPVFGNTKKYYVLDVNSVGYYTRRFEIRLRGDTSNYDLQPYLPPTPSSGEFVFYVKNASNITPLSGVQIDVERTIPGEGTKQTQNITTDYAGTATISLLLGVDYTVYFFYNSIPVHTATIRPTAASLYYQVSLDVSVTIPTPPPLGSLDVNFSPSAPVLLPQSNGWLDFNVGIAIKNKTISGLTITVFDSNGGCFGKTSPCDTNHFSSWADGNFLQYHLDGNRFNTQYSLFVVVDVNTTDGNVFRATKNYTVIISAEWDLWNRLTKTANELNGASGKAVTSLIAAILVLCIVGALAFGGVSEPFILALISLFILGFFVAISWVAWEPVAAIALFTMLLFMLQYRGGG